MELQGNRVMVTGSDRWDPGQEAAKPFRPPRATVMVPARYN